MVQFHVFSHNGTFCKKNIFSNVVSVRCRLLDCSPGTIMQTEGKMPTEVFFFFFFFFFPLFHSSQIQQLQHK